MSQLPINVLQVNNQPQPAKTTSHKNNSTQKIQNPQTPNPPNNKAEATPQNGFAAILARQLNQSSHAESATELSSDAALLLDPALQTSEPTTNIVAETPSSTDASSMIASLLQQVNLQPPANNNAETSEHTATNPVALQQAFAANTTNENSALVDVEAHTKPAVNTPAHDAAEASWQQQLTQANSQLSEAANETANLELVNSPTPTNLNPSQLLPNNLAPTNNANQALVVNTPVGQTAWSQDFSQQISWMSHQKISSAELQLNPANLGPVSVSLEIDQDQQATLSFHSPHAAVREAIENSLPRLRESLAENGITLGNTNVSDQTPREQPRQFAETQNRQQRDSAPNDKAGDNTPNSNHTSNNQAASKHNGLLNVFA